MKMFRNIYIMLFAIVFNNQISFSQTSIFSQLNGKITFVVAKDGSGQYSRIMDAINATPNNSNNKTVIFIKHGKYTEKVEIPSAKSNLTIIGEQADNTIISYNDFSGSGKIYNGIISSAVGVAIGTSTSHTMYVQANDFTMMNITVENTAGNVGQAVALNSNGDRQFFYHCKLKGYQDTYYTWSNGRFYLKDCYIEGAVDFIFGRGVAYFDSCSINSIRSSSYITAASTEQNWKYGYVFNRCKLTANTGVSSVFLGRPWKAYAQTVFMNSDEGAFINTDGWHIWDGNTNHTTCYYAEYKNCGTGSNTSKRVSWSHQLSDATASNYTISTLFSKAVNPIPFTTDWNPTPDADVLYKIVKGNTTRFITSACFQASVNTPPSVSISLPVNNSSFTAPASITLNANASDVNGTITNVQFFNGATLLGSDANAPYSFVWTNVTKGNYSITARATDNSGAVTTSSVITVVVNDPSSNSTIIQAESACAVDGITNETVNSGFHGSGYVNTNNALNASVSWSVQSSNSQTVTLLIRYANLSTTNRKMSLSINGTLQISSIGFPSTGAWTTWSITSATVSLAAGTNNIKLIALTNEGGPNIDELTYGSGVLSVGACNAIPLAQIQPSAIYMVPAVVAPNPGSEIFTLSVSESVQSYSVTNTMGDLLVSGGAIVKNGSTNFGETLENGFYTLHIFYSTGRIERISVQKIR